MKNFFRYKDIIFYRTLAGLKSEARKSYLGYIWFILEPALSTGVLYFAMAHLTGNRGAEAAFAILIGMIAWQWFEGSVMLSAHSIVGKFHVHMQVPLPKYIFPLVDVGMNTTRFMFAFTLVNLAWLFIGGPSMALLWLPMILALQLLLIVGVSMVTSVMVTLVSDLRVPLQSCFRLLFFISGIFFSIERVPEHLRSWFYANPIATLIESYRAVILHARAPDFNHLTLTAATVVGFLLIGTWVQAYFDKRLLKLTNV